MRREEVYKWDLVPRCLTKNQNSELTDYHIIDSDEIRTEPALGHGRRGYHGCGGASKAR